MPRTQVYRVSADELILSIDALSALILFNTFLSTIDLALSPGNSFISFCFRKLECALSVGADFSVTVLLVLLPVISKQLLSESSAGSNM